MFRKKGWEFKKKQFFFVYILLIIQQKKKTPCFQKFSVSGYIYNLDVTFNFYLNEILLKNCRKRASSEAEANKNLNFKEEKEKSNLKKKQIRKQLMNQEIEINIKIAGECGEKN